MNTLKILRRCPNGDLEVFFQVSIWTPGGFFRGIHLDTWRVCFAYSADGFLCVVLSVDHASCEFHYSLSGPETDIFDSRCGLEPSHYFLV